MTHLEQRIGLVRSERAWTVHETMRLELLERRYGPLVRDWRKP